MATRNQQRLGFTLGLVAIGCANAALRMPADPGRAHWSEWFSFYFTPPVAEGVLFGAICWLAIGVSESKVSVRVPLVGVLIAVLAVTAVPLIGRALR